MKAYKILTSNYDKAIIVVSDDLEEAEKILKKEHEDAEIVSIEVISNNVLMSGLDN